MRIEDLGQIPYREAWALQERLHEEVMAGAEETILLVEHPPVITYGRRPGVDRNLRATPEQLAERSVEIVQSDRGGDITFHGPGQLVAYPIIRLANHGFSVSGYVHALEAAVIATLAELGIEAVADPQAVGVWTREGDAIAKICAIGVRIRRGVSLHGLALNVNVDLSYFNLIVPCGLEGRAVTSLAKLLGPNVGSALSLRSFRSTALPGDVFSPASAARKGGATDKISSSPRTLSIPAQATARGASPTENANASLMAQIKPLLGAHLLTTLGK